MWEKGLIERGRDWRLLLALWLLLPVSCLAQGLSSDALYRALQERPRDVVLLNSYGIAQAQTGDLIGAIRTWRYAVDIDPRYVHLFNNIGGALRRLGQKEDALAWYQAALERQGDAWWIWYNLALLQLDLGRSKDVRGTLVQVLRLNPEHRQAREQMALLEQEERRAAAVAVTTVGRAVRPPTPLPTPLPIREQQQPRPVVAVGPETGNIDPSGSLPVSRAGTRMVSPETTSAAKRSPRSPDREALPVLERSVSLRLPEEPGGQVFLTFDGGAGAKGLDRILSSLAAHRVRSTFFLTGKWVEEYPDLARQIEAAGHEIANHSYSHKDMKHWSKEKIGAELEKAELAFQQVLGHRGAPYFRFPFGHQNRVSEGHSEALGYRPVYWHIDTIDWREDPVSTIIQRVKKKIHRGAVILMHVGSNNGATALPEILAFLTERGYQPARLSDLSPGQLAALP